jgi:hypothetical protein
MAAFEKANPPPEPVVSGGTNWAFFDRQSAIAESDNGLAELLRGDDEGFLRKSIPLAINSVRGVR